MRIESVPIRSHIPNTDPDSGTTQVKLGLKGWTGRQKTPSSIRNLFMGQICCSFKEQIFQ